VRAEESLARQALYILGNPVRAGLARQVGEYPHAWSIRAWCRPAAGTTGAVRAEQVLYILANPVRAGIVQLIGEYPHAWSAWTW